MGIRTDVAVTSCDVARACRELAAANEYVHYCEIGVSRRGVPLPALTFGGGAKLVMVNAAHHANEWITTLVLMRFAEECAAELRGGAAWASQVTFCCIPLVNPDGVDMLERGQGDWKANACGVDLNSNYPAGWDATRERKFAQGYKCPGARDYVGPAPLSEPESCAMAAYTALRDADVTISLHTQGEEIYWQHKGFNPPGAAELAQRMAVASGYALVEVPPESTGAGYRDWFIEAFNRPGFTIECGLGENPLPLSQFEDIYARVSALLRVFM